MVTFSQIEIQKMHPEATLPTRAHPEDAGMDLYALEDVFLSAHQGKLARTGIAMAIPQGFVGMVADRSSMAKKGIKTAGGIIDAGYRGEIMVVLWNLTGEELKLGRGDRIAQLLLLPIATPAVVGVDKLSETERGAKGFGSSGR